MPRNRQRSRTRDLEKDEEKEYDSLEAIPAELKRLASILAMSDVKDRTQTEQMVFLDRFGFTLDEIAKLVDSTPSSVSQQLYSVRQGKASKKGKKGRKSATPHKG